MKRFTLPDCVKTNNLNGRIFDKDRTLTVSDDEGAKLKLVLVRHYGCKVEDVSPKPLEEGEETSLVSTVTKDPT